MSFFDLPKKDEFRRLLIEPLSRLPRFFLHPRLFFAEHFQGTAPITAALTSAAALFALSLAAYSAIGLQSGAEASSVLYLTVGTLTLWIGYALFLHVFVFVFGGRRGVSFTIAVYVYVMGFLQPVFVVVLWLLTCFMPGAVSLRTITGGFGGSGGSALIAEGRFFSADVAMYFRLISGLLILIYFAMGVTEAHRLRLWKGIAASICSAIFFFVVFIVILLIDNVTGIGIVTRIVGG